MAAPGHPPMGPICFVFWADRGPGASCPYGEGPRRALVTFPRWKVTRGFGGAAPQSCPQTRFDVSPPQAALGPRWRSAPKLPAGTLRCKPPQAALGPRCRSAPKLPTGTLGCNPAAGGSWAKMSQRPGNSYRRPAYFPRPLQFPAVCAMLKRRNAPRLREEPLYVRFTYP